jgi:hypothetical protein
LSIVWFSSDNLFLTLMQAACVALAAAGLPLWATRYRARGWALVAPLSVALVIGAIALIPQTANVLTWVALVLVPIGAALAFGWAGHGARAPLALLATVLLALAWALPSDRVGQAAAAILITASAVTAGRLVAGAAPLTLVKAGVVVMAVVDSVLVFTNQLQGPNATLVTASPGAGLPQLQSLSFGSAGLGYGDVFAAAVVGAVLAAERAPQLRAALGLLVVTLAWDQLFLVDDVLPATVPPAIVLVAWWARTHNRAGAAVPRDVAEPTRDGAERRRARAGHPAPAGVADPAVH